MRARRTALIAAAAAAAIALIAGGTYAFAGDEQPPGGSAAGPEPAGTPSEGVSADPGTPATSPTTPPTSAAPTGSADSGDDEKAKDDEDEAEDDHGCETGENQKKVEALLNELGGFGTLTVDGEQSRTDCEAIKKFQERYDIRPPEGRAGPLTYDVARRLAETDIEKCDGDDGLVACIDLTHQTTWIMKDGEIIVDPTVTRTGMAGGYQTPAGKYEINRRAKKEWSNPYEVWLPYWQHFVGGMGFHETTTYLHDSFGSHGCVNLLHKDAVKFYETLKMGTTVHIFGRRPGT